MKRGWVALLISLKFGRAWPTILSKQEYSPIMSDDSAQDKQLPATARKLQKAKEEGQVVRSKDLGHFLVVLAATGVLMGLTPVWMGHLQKMLHAGLRFDARTVAAPEMMAERLSEWAIEGLLVVLPFAAGIMLAAVAASVLAGGWVMSFKVLQPKFSKLNPLSGIGRVFSKQQLVDALKASLLGLILGVVGIALLYQAWPRTVDLLAMPLPAAIATLVLILLLTMGHDTAPIDESYDLIQILPYVLVLAGGVAGINVFIVLLTGIVSGAVIMLLTGQVEATALFARL